VAVQPVTNEHLPPGAPVATTLPGRALPLTGLSSISLGVLAVLVLHVVPPSSRTNPMTRTISEYALGGNGWLFDLGVLALAVGSAAVAITLIRSGALAATAPATILIFGWTAALVVLVVFEKYDYSNGPSTGPSGLIHRMASLVAFLCLPAGAALAARIGRRDERWRPVATRVRYSSWVSSACLGLLFYAVGQSFVTDVKWWRVFPLGALERLIALAEIVTLYALGFWALHTARSPDPSADLVGDGRGGTTLVQ
jgi:hypothetical protein